MSKEIPHYNPFGNNENNESNLNLTKEKEKKGFFNSVVKLLSSIKFWTIVSAIAGVLSLVYIIWKDIDHRTEREKIVASINDLCSEIKDTFHPSSIVLDGDSLGDLHLIQDFQQTSLDYANLIESIITSFSFKNNSDNDLVFKEILDNSNKRKKDTSNNRIKIVKDIGTLEHIGRKYNIDDYLHFDYSKLNEDKKILNDEADKLEKSLKELDRYKGRKYMEKVLDLHESTYNSIDFLKSQELFLNYIIDCNKFINNRLSKMKR